MSFLPHLPSKSCDATLSMILDADYWRSLVPFLGVNGTRWKESSAESSATHAGKKSLAAAMSSQIMPPDLDLAADMQTHQRNIVNHGFSLVGHQRYLDQNLIEQLSFAASLLDYYGWPVTFLAVYDETWDLAGQCEDWMTQLTSGRNTFCLDIVGFSVVGGAGFSPHRDRQPSDWQPKGHVEESPEGTFDSGFARYITCWVALSDAHPGNSCMHYVSAQKDPGYYAGDPADGDPLQRCFGNDKSSFQHIRACPVSKGAFVAHTHRVIHWGNQGEPDLDDEHCESKNWQFATEWEDQTTRLFELSRGTFVSTVLENPGLREDFFRQICHTFANGGSHREGNRVLSKIPANKRRVAISFAFSNNSNYSDGGAFEPPYVKRSCIKDGKVPDFETRAALCSAQILNYSPLSQGDPKGWMTLAGKILKRSHLRILYNVFKKKEKNFAAHYRKEISTKFVEISLSISNCCEGADIKKECSESANEAIGKNTSHAKTKLAHQEHAPSKRKLNREADESDLEDEALAAMLESERSLDTVLFHDDFDMLVSEGELGAVKVDKRRNKPARKKVKKSGIAKKQKR